MAASARGPWRSGEIFVQPTACGGGEAVTVSGRWLECQRSEGSQPAPMVAVEVELSFAPVADWMTRAWKVLDVGVTDARGNFAFISFATVSGLYRVGVTGSEGGRHWVSSEEVVVRHP